MLRTLVLGCLLTLLVSLGNQAFALDAPEQRLIADEASKIAATGGAVLRSDGSLTIHAANGKFVTRHDDRRCEDTSHVIDGGACVRCVFVDHFARQHGYLLLVLFYEDSEYEWVDDLTGEATIIADQPHFSPSGRRFVVVRGTESEGFNGIQVWAWRGGRLVKEWEHRPAGYALYEFKEWQGDDTVLLTVTTWVDHKIVEGLPVRLEKPSKWTLQGPPEASR